MFFPGKDGFMIQKTVLIKRKDTEQFPARYQKSDREGIFQFISERKGSLTLETALVLPIFLFAMLAMLQFAAIQYATSAFLAGAQDTVKEMAAYAYIQQLGMTEQEGLTADLLKGGLSMAYAKGQVQKRAGIGRETGSISLLKSDFTDAEILDLTGTFTPAHTYTILPVRKVKSIFRARVRAWTGRQGNGAHIEGEEETKQQEEERTVYVAETGTVYHTDPECTHISLSIQSVSASLLKGYRNVSGGKYHACEKCKGNGNGTVYISPYGEKYHSSLSCSGLKRTIKTMTITEAGNLKPCSKCGKR